MTGVPSPAPGSAEALGSGEAFGSGLVVGGGGRRGRRVGGAAVGLGRDVAGIGGGVHRQGDRVAQGRAAVCAEAVDGVPDLAPVGRGLHDEPGVGGEGDEPDPERGGQAVDEARGGGLGGREPGRVDVGRGHRAGDVHRQHHGRLLARDLERHRRSGEGDDEERHRAEVQGGRHVPPPAGRARHEVREQVDVGKPHHVPGAPTLDEDVGAQRQRNEEQARQQEGLGEGHGSNPWMRSWSANERSQLPDVDRTT